MIGRQFTSLALIRFAVEELREFFELIARDAYKDAYKRRGERHSLHVFTRQLT